MTNKKVTGTVLKCDFSSNMPSNGLRELFQNNRANLNGIVTGETSIVEIGDRINIRVEEGKDEGRVYFSFNTKQIGFIESHDRGDGTLVIEYFSNINFFNEKLKSENSSYEELSEHLSVEYFGNLKVTGLGTYMFHQFLLQNFLIEGKNKISLDSLDGSQGFYRGLGFKQFGPDRRLESSGEIIRTLIYPL